VSGGAFGHTIIGRKMPESRSIINLLYCCKSLAARRELLEMLFGWQFLWICNPLAYAEYIGMRVGVLSLLMDQWLLMASRAFAMCGHEVLIVTNPEPHLV
jgi:hypothetical protein